MMHALVETKERNRVVNQSTTRFFKQKGSTLRNFSVVRVFDGYYTVCQLSSNLDLSITINYEAHEMKEGLPPKLMAITGDQYDEFVKAYKQHVKMALLRSGAHPSSCPKVKLHNPHWRVDKLKQTR